MSARLWTLQRSCSLPSPMQQQKVHTCDRVHALFVVFGCCHAATCHAVASSSATGSGAGGGTVNCPVLCSHVSPSLLSCTPPPAT